MDLSNTLCLSNFSPELVHGVLRCRVAERPHYAGTEHPRSVRERYVRDIQLRTTSLLIIRGRQSLHRELILIQRGRRRTKTNLSIGKLVNDVVVARADILELSRGFCIGLSLEFYEE